MLNATVREDRGKAVRACRCAIHAMLVGYNESKYIDAKNSSKKDIAAILMFGFFSSISRGLNHRQRLTSFLSVTWLFHLQYIQTITL